MKLSSNWGSDHGNTGYAQNKITKKMQHAWDKVTCIAKTIVDSPVGQSSMPLCSTAGHALAFAQEIFPLVSAQSDSLAETTEMFGSLGDAFQEVKKVQVLSLARVGFIGYDCYGVAEEWKEASKPRDYGKAFLATLGVVQDTIDLPERIINIVDLFQPAVKAAANLGAWVPWITLVSTALSIGSIALASLRLWETDKFARNIRDKCELALVNYIRDLGVEGSPVFQVSLAQALEAVSHAEAVVKLKQIKAELNKKDGDSGALAVLIGSLTASYLVHTQPLFEAVNRQDVAANSGDGQALKEAVEKDLLDARRARDAIPLHQAVRELKNELKVLRPESMPALNELANVAYVEKLRSMDEKVLERHYQVEGKVFKASIERIWRTYQATVAIDHDTAVFKLEKAVTLLKGRISESRMFHIWSIVARTVAFVASIIFLALSFGVVCAPLAPIAYLLMACLGIVSIVKIFIMHQRQREFEERIGVTEHRLCTSWEGRLEKTLKKADGKIQCDLVKLQEKLAERDFRVACPSITIDAEAGDRERKNVRIYNQIAGEMNGWRKKHYIHSSAPL